MTNERDNFFKSNPDSSLTERILKNAKPELELNKNRLKQKRIFVILMPVLSALAASFIAFKIFTPNINQHQSLPNVEVAESALALVSDFLGESEQSEIISAILNEEEEFLEIAEELSLLQEFDEIENVSDEELEG